MRLAFLAGVLLVAGCAPHFDIGGGDWKKPGAQVQETTVDEMDCARTASRAYMTPDLVVGGVVDAVRVAIENGQMERAFSGCMRGKGYQPARS